VLSRVVSALTCVSMTVVCVCVCMRADGVVCESTAVAAHTTRARSAADHLSLCRTRWPPVRRMVMQRALYISVRMRMRTSEPVPDGWSSDGMNLNEQRTRSVCVESDIHAFDELQRHETTRGTKIQTREQHERVQDKHISRWMVHLIGLGSFRLRTIGRSERPPRSSTLDSAARINSIHEPPPSFSSPAPS
jgi:hypothetical protein